MLAAIAQKQLFSLRKLNHEMVLFLNKFLTLYFTRQSKNEITLHHPEKGDARLYSLRAPVLLKLDLLA